MKRKLTGLGLLEVTGVANEDGRAVLECAAARGEVDNYIGQK